MMASIIKYDAQLSSNNEGSPMSREKIMEFSFPHKLWIVVNSKLYSFICWIGDGTIFGFDMNALENHLRARASIFKTKTIYSFLAQLQKYEFVRLPDTVQPWLHFSHPYFQRSRIDLLAKVRLTMPYGATIFPDNTTGVMTDTAPEKIQIIKGDLPKMELNMFVEHANVQRTLASKLEAGEKQCRDGSNVQHIDSANPFCFYKMDQTVTHRDPIKQENPLICGMYGDREKLELFFGEKYRYLLDTDFSEAATIASSQYEAAGTRLQANAYGVQDASVPPHARNQEKSRNTRKVPRIFKLSKRERRMLLDEDRLNDDNESSAGDRPKATPLAGHSLTPIFHEPTAAQTVSNSSFEYSFGMSNEIKTEPNSDLEESVWDSELHLKQEFEKTCNEFAPQFNSTARTVGQPNSMDIDGSNMHEGDYEMDANPTKEHTGPDTAYTDFSYALGKTFSRI